MSLVFRRGNGGALALAEKVLAVFDEQRQLADGSAESGGILLGRWIQESNDVVVDSATRPGPEDRRGRFFFWRARRPAQEIVDAAWAQSRGTLWYLGEWHSHPERHPSPSAKDQGNWLRILRKAQFEQPVLFFVIVGHDELAVWEGCKATGLLTGPASKVAP